MISLQSIIGDRMMMSTAGQWASGVCAPCLFNHLMMQLSDVASLLHE